MPSNDVVDDKITPQSILNVLNDESDEKETKSDDKTEDKNEPEVKPLKLADEDDEKTEDDEEKVELSEDEDDETEEEPVDELITPPRRKEILAKYPQLFKDFPYLAAAYYREQQFTEILPTIEDAKEAVEKANSLTKFEADLMKGSNQSVLKSVRDNDEAAFARLVDNYLPSLKNVDERAFNHVVGDVINSVIYTMAQEAHANSNEKLQEAALILNQFITGSSQYKPKGKFSGNTMQTEEAKSEVSQERQQFLQEKFESAKEELDTRTTNVLKSTVSQHIDPKGVMSDYVKKNAIKESIEQLESTLASDSRFRVVLNKLWEKAAKDGFSKSSQDAIKTAYLSRAKSLLPSIIQKSRNEALRGMGKRVVDNKETNSVRKTESNTRSVSTSKADTKIPARNVKTIDFLNQD